MPINDAIKVKCSFNNCYWNMGNYKSNCAAHSITLSDEQCDQFITKEEAATRLAKALGKDQEEAKS